MECEMKLGYTYSSSDGSGKKGTQLGTKVSQNPSFDEQGFLNFG